MVRMTDPLLWFSRSQRLTQRICFLVGFLKRYNWFYLFWFKLSNLHIFLKIGYVHFNLFMIPWMILKLHFQVTSLQLILTYIASHLESVQFFGHFIGSKFAQPFAKFRNWAATYDWQRIGFWLRIKNNLGLFSKLYIHFFGKLSLK